MKPSAGRTPTLREAQHWMAARILNPLGQNPAPGQPDLEAWLEPPARGDVTERLRVYAAGYPARVHEALAETYPAVAHLAGHRAFADLAREFAAAVPLHSYNLNDAGAQLPDFLTRHTLSARLPFLADLARLEWQVARAFHAADEEPLDPAPLAAWSLEQWDCAVLQFQPWVGLVSSEWPLRALWECRETPIAQINLDLRDHPDRVLVRRAALQVHCESLDSAEAEMLAALLGGTTLGSAVARLPTSGNPDGVSQWLARWMSLGMIAGIRLEFDK